MFAQELLRFRYVRHIPVRVSLLLPARVKPVSARPQDATLGSALQRWREIL